MTERQSAYLWKGGRSAEEILELNAKYEGKTCKSHEVSLSTRNDRNQHKTVHTRTSSSSRLSAKDCSFFSPRLSNSFFLIRFDTKLSATTFPWHMHIEKMERSRKPQGTYQTFGLHHSLRVPFLAPRPPSCCSSIQTSTNSRQRHSIAHECQGSITRFTNQKSHTGCLACPSSRE